ncbi:Uncharacterized protein FWK35_00024777, partial [Aphis craccivora]
LQPYKKVDFKNWSCVKMAVSFLNSERSDECIDYTMLSLVHWGGHFLNFPIVFKSAGKNQKKIKEKREFLRKTSFRPNRFLYGCNSKTNHCKYLKFSPNVPYELLSFENVKICKIKNTTLRNSLLRFAFYLLIPIAQFFLLFCVFMPLKYKPPFSVTTGNYILG